MRSFSSLLSVITQGALALLPHSPASTGQQQQQQNLRGVLPASTVTIDTHAHYRRDAAQGAINLGAEPLTWTATGKKIKVNGKPFHLKGVSWFGLELQQGRYAPKMVA